MVTKRRKAAPRRRTYAARRAAPRRRANKSGVQYIPGAMATAALVVAEAPQLKQLYKAATNNGREFSKIPDRLMNNEWTHNALYNFLKVDNLTKAGVAVAGGYVAGEIVKKYAPGVIKRPLGKIAKKIPKVI